MYKIILVFFFTLAVAQPEVCQDEDYIARYNDEFQNVIDAYDTKIVQFKEFYIDHVAAAVVNSESIYAALVRSNKRLSPFVLLGDDFNHCVSKYRLALPNATVTQKAIETCELRVAKKIPSLISALVVTRNVLHDHFKNFHGVNLKDCAYKNKNTTNYKKCISKVTLAAINFTNRNQNQFAVQLDDAVFTANVNIKALLSCCYTKQSEVFSTIADANRLISKCFEEKHERK